MLSTNVPKYILTELLACRLLVLFSIYSNYIKATWPTGQSLRHLFIPLFQNCSFSFWIILPSLCLNPGRNVPSPWVYSNFPGLMVWPRKSRGNLWTPPLSLGDSTTSATHGPTPAWRYDTHSHKWVLLWMNTKERRIYHYHCEVQS